MWVGRPAPHHEPRPETRQGDEHDDQARRAATEYRYEKLTWPEINDAIALGKVCIVPCGAVEQHGPHLPLDVDLICPTEIARGAGRAVPDKILVLPTVCYGYTGHVMDFPGTINNDFEHFMHHVLDITKSLAYHGFKKIILLNGHGSNMPNLDLAARRGNLETDAECVLIAWWQLLNVEKDFHKKWRQSKVPGGCAHALATPIAAVIATRACLAFIGSLLCRRKLIHAAGCRQGARRRRCNSPAGPNGARRTQINAARPAPRPLRNVPAARHRSP